MPRKKIPVIRRVRIIAYNVMAQAVENGVEYGWNRAHKHTDTPDDVTIKQAIIDAVMNDVCEWFDFAPEEEV